MALSSAEPGRALPRRPIMEPIRMSTYEGSKQEVRKAVVRVAHAEGRLETMARLDDLAAAAFAWRRVLSVDPRAVEMIEERRDRRFMAELEQAA